MTTHTNEPPDSTPRERLQPDVAPQDDDAELDARELEIRAGYAEARVLVIYDLGNGVKVAKTCKAVVRVK
jgi:hypothetical protein